MEKIRVVVAGLPGKMATLVARAVMAQEDMDLHPLALGEKNENIGDLGFLVPMADHEKVLRENRKDIDLVVDFTQPTAVNRNAEMYCALGIPFVMGTTGGDRKKLDETVRASDVAAVIATNMAAPVVVFQEMMRVAAERFPGAFEGFDLSIHESHQAAKKNEISGTAISLLPYFEALGMPLEKEQIHIQRDPHWQEVLHKIPREHLGGHGYHTYNLHSRDGTVDLEFVHNVRGRNVYVDGALKAIRFLARKKNGRGKVFSMADVLRG